MEEQLLALLERFRDRLPAEDYAHIRDMVEHREWGVGLQDLCTQLFEHSISVGASDLAKIKELTAKMGLPVDTWNFLAPS